jgi:hypothetical protein
MLLVSEAFQVRVNLRDLRVGNLRPRKCWHQADPLAHDRHEFGQIFPERHQRRPLTAARTGSVARFAHPGEYGLPRIIVLLLRERGRRRGGNLQPHDHERTQTNYCHAILNAS